MIPVESSSVIELCASQIHNSRWHTVFHQHKLQIAHSQGHLSQLQLRFGTPHPNFCCKCDFLFVTAYTQASAQVVTVQWQLY